MRGVLVLLVVVGLTGCTIIGPTTGVVIGSKNNYAIDHAALLARPTKFVPVPTEAQRAACESRRQAGFAAANVAATGTERQSLLAAVPNCLDVYVVTGIPMPDPIPPPAPRPRESVAGYALIGLLVGVALDTSFVLLYRFQCRHSAEAHECL